MKNILNVNKASLKATLMSSIIVFSTFTLCSAITNKVACASFKKITPEEWNNIDLDYIHPDSELDEWSNTENSFKEITLHGWNSLDFGENIWPGRYLHKDDGSGITPEEWYNLHQGTGVFRHTPPYGDERTDPTPYGWYNDENGREFIQVDGVEEWIKYCKDIVKAYEISPKDRQGWLNIINEAANNQVFPSEEDRETFVSNIIQELDNEILDNNPEKWPDKRDGIINETNKFIEMFQKKLEKGIHTINPPVSEEDSKNWEKFNSLFQQGGSSNPEENQPKLRSTEAQSCEYEEEKESVEEISGSTGNRPNSYDAEPKNEETTDPAGNSCNIA